MGRIHAVDNNSFQRLHCYAVACFTKYLDQKSEGTCHCSLHFVMFGVAGLCSMVEIDAVRRTLFVIVQAFYCLQFRPGYFPVSVCVSCCDECVKFCSHHSLSSA